MMSDRGMQRSSFLPQGLNIPQSTPSRNWTNCHSPRERTTSIRLYSSSTPSSPRTTPRVTPNATPSSTPPDTPREKPVRKTRAEVYNEVTSINHGIQSVVWRMSELEKLTTRIADQNELQISAKKQRSDTELMAQKIEEIEIEEERDEGYEDFLNCITHYNKCIIL